jgi:putative flippase GtrA
MRDAMGLVSRIRMIGFRLQKGWRYGALGLKAVSFALIGVINASVDYSVFLAARAAFSHSSAASSLFDWASAGCGCASATTVSLVGANIISWSVAVSGSYVLNSSITFAAESGRKLGWRRYFAFAASGIFGWLANTATLLFVAEGLLLPVWLAKAVAILASFVVNFSLSHFVVFRTRHRPALDTPDQA